MLRSLSTPSRITRREALALQERPAARLARSGTSWVRRGLAGMRSRGLFAFSLACVLLGVAASPRPVLAMIATDRVRDVIRAASPQFVACTERCLACPPGDYLTTIGFTIASDGTVSEAEVRDSDLPDPATSACFVRVVLGLRFPSFGSAPHTGSVRVNYPFRVHVGT